MNAWVLLLRGLNVGGRNRLAMAPLRGMLKRLGLRQVRSVLQSGNLVFTGVIDARAFGGIVEDVIAEAHGFRPRALVLSGDSFGEIAAAYPWPEAWGDPTRGHVWFLDRPSETPLAALTRIAAPRERVALTERALYLHAPDGIGRSKLAARAEDLLGVATTARNLATIQRITGLLGALRDD